MSNQFSIKQLWAELKTALKQRYWAAAWPIAGGMLLLLAITMLLSMGVTRCFMTFMMMFQMMMYGMGSLSMASVMMLAMIVMIVLLVVIEFFIQFLSVGSAYAWLDYIRHPEMQMNSSMIWKYFKHLKKNQIIRLTLYISLFIFLWQLPLSIIGSLPFIARVQWLSVALKVINDIIVIWKSLEYSQAIFAYRDRQADFLGQSMRHALTASRRLMGGFKAKYLASVVLFIALPMLVLGVIFGGIAFYGNYTGTYPIMWMGLGLLIIFELMFMPIALLVCAQFYNDITDDQLVDDSFVDTFKPVEVLTGEKYKDDWKGVAKSTTKSVDPQVKADDHQKTEAKKND